MRYRKLPVLLCVVCALLVLAGCGSAASSASDPPLPTPGTVSATSHPLVANYGVVAPSAGTVSVEFGTSPSYGRSTGSVTVPTGGGTVQVMVGGMRANTTYHMRARVALASGTLFLDSDHTFKTGALPQVSFPSVKVTPSGLSNSGGVELISGVGPNASAVVLDTDGSIIWYYYDPSLAAGDYAFP